MKATKREHLFRHPLRRGRLLTDRDDFLMAAANGRRVVHVGCVDWPVSKDRLADGTLLHPKLQRVAAEVIGVDIDVEGLQALENALGGVYSSIDLTDPAADISPLAEFRPDVIIAGDVIEHVPSAQALLEGLRRLAQCSGAKVIVTTPNSLAFRSVLNTTVGIELMHPDHVAIYSPTTLETLMARSGLVIDSWQYYSIHTGTDLGHRSYDFVARSAARLRAAWGDGHLVTCLPS